MLIRGSDFGDHVHTKTQPMFLCGQIFAIWQLKKSRVILAKVHLGKILSLGDQKNSVQLTWRISLFKKYTKVVRFWGFFFIFKLSQYRVDMLVNKHVSYQRTLNPKTFLLCLWSAKVFLRSCLSISMVI